MEDRLHKNPEIFTVKENVPAAKSPITSEEALTLPTSQVLSRLETSPQGLNSEDATGRLNIYGTNELAHKQKPTAIVSLLLHFKSPLIIILLIAAFIAGALGDLYDFTIIFVIVIISVSIDHYQESKAENAAELLKEKVSTKTTVLRDNTKIEIKLSQIVPGDIISLSAEDITPTDARIIGSSDFSFLLRFSGCKVFFLFHLKSFLFFEINYVVLF